jgi:ribosome biogenesis GTPase
MISLESLGWDAAFENSLSLLEQPELWPGRIVRQHRGVYEALTRTDAGLVVPCEAKITGRFLHETSDPSEFPCVGDWVALRPPQSGGPAMIQTLVPRRSLLARKSAGTSNETQLFAANIDFVFLVASMNADFSLNRIERAVAMVRGGGALPVVVLTKADLRPDWAAYAADAQRAARDVPVHAVSSTNGDGLQALSGYFAPGRTSVLIGSSGVGKSTLVNALFGDERALTGTIREEDSKGRHTTTTRQLFVSENGGILIDTPGIREIQLDGGATDVGAAFADIEELATSCRFGDCQHGNEPGCAVRVAISDGRLDERRWQSFEKLGREAAHQARKEDPLLLRAERAKWKKISKAHRRSK